jgi:hypothetical protein
MEQPNKIGTLGVVVCVQFTIYSKNSLCYYYFENRNK